MSNLIDFHTHILPGIDDGSKNTEQSLALLRLEGEQGIRRVVATPHFYAHHDSPEAFLTRRANAVSRLREAAAAEPDLPELEVGAEVYYFNGISNTDLLQKLTVGSSRYVLIEMPMSPWTSRMYRELAEIREKQELIPIVAHVDRYLSPFRTHGIPDRLAELPVLVQANASFFLHRGTRRMALRMLREGRIHLLGSDCHNLSDRAPNLAAAEQIICRHLGQDGLDSIFACQQQVLEL